MGILLLVRTHNCQTALQGLPDCSGTSARFARRGGAGRLRAAGREGEAGGYLIPRSTTALWRRIRDCKLCYVHLLYPSMQTHEDPTTNRIWERYFQSGKSCLLQHGA